VGLYGYIEQIPVTYIICATFVTFASILWAWNQIIWRSELSLIKSMIREAKSPTGLPDKHAPPKPFATQDDFQSRTITGKTVPIYALPRDRLFVKNREFIDCDIEGPSVILPFFNTSFENCSWGLPESDAKSLMFPIAKDRTMTGIIGLLDCVFRGCRIRNIGVAGPKKELDAFIDAISNGGMR